MEDSGAIGIDGDANDDSVVRSGAAYLFQRSGDVFTPGPYLKSCNPEPEDEFGSSVALSDDGETLAASATEEDSAATGVGGDSNDNSAGESGAVYVY